MKPKASSLGSSNRPHILVVVTVLLLIAPLGTVAPAEALAAATARKATTGGDSGAVQEAATGQETAPSRIPSHPSELQYPELEFEVPVAEEHRHDLSNGVVAYVVEDHTLPLVDVSVLVRTGAYLDPEGKEGLAGLVGSLLRSGGTENLTASEFDEEADYLAAHISSGIGDTQGGADLNVLSKDLDAGLDLFFDMLRNPAFQQDRLELGKSQAMQAMQRRNDDTGTIERREWTRLMRGDDHFTAEAATRASVESIDRQDLLDFHERYFHPGNFIFAVSGDVDTRQVLADLEARMEDWAADGPAVPEPPAPDHEPEPGLYLVDKEGVNQGRVSMGHLATTYDNPDHYALLVMNQILGHGDFSSRILRRVRSDEGLAYSARSSYGLGIYYDGVFTAGFQSKSDSVARAAAIVLEEIERIRQEPVSDEELQTAITSFVETFPRRFSSARATAALFADDEYYGRDPDYWQSYRDRIHAVDVEDVLRVAREYLHPDDLVILVVGDIEEILAGDPESPEASLLTLTGDDRVHRIPLPDPMTMVYPQDGTSEPAEEEAAEGGESPENGDDEEGGRTGEEDDIQG